MNLEAIPPLDRRGLRRFGATSGLIAAGLFGLLLPWLLDHSLPLWPWILGGSLSAVALAVPQALKPVYHVWMRIGAVLGVVNTRFVLVLLYVGLIIPVGLLFRLMGRDTMRRALTGAASYRVHSPSRDRKHFEKPY